MQRFFLLLCLAVLTSPLLGADKPHAIVLVHGAFADGSSWSKVIPFLQARGMTVVAVQNPLTSLADDVATVKRAIDNQKDPVILVGHSYGGAVITEAGNHENVKALVYVAAFAPGADQSAFELAQAYPAAPGLANVQMDSAGFQTLTMEAMAKDFAQDLAAEETAVMTATQGPIAVPCFVTKISKPAWKDKKSWYVVAEQDRMIQPDLQRDVAKKMNATIKSLPSSHVPLLSQPEEVANVILAAAQADDGTAASR